MFNYHERLYIFKKSDGEIISFFHDARQNICYQLLINRRTWSSPVVLHRNAYKYFYVDMDRDNVFHIVFQDNEGNINYSRLGGQTIRSVPVLNSKTPLVYDKKLFLAPLKEGVYIFYVLQHENSFFLGYQVLSGGRIGNPKVVDYVSGSSIPCSIVYDRDENIYVFYQAHDGKYMQLGYRKYTIAQRSWSEFSSITKFSGNCEYPRSLVDENGVIHLLYQRKGSRYYELVYQQKTPDKHLWSEEFVIHSSPYSFENASILNSNGDIIVYWVRENTIYYSTGTQGGYMWMRPARLSFPASRTLQCISFKANASRDNGVHLPPGIYPGSLSYGLQLAFYPGETSEDISRQMAWAGADGADGNVAAKKIIMDTFRKMQGNIDDVRESLCLTRMEISKLANSYNELKTEMNKFAIRLKMIESRLASLEGNAAVKAEHEPESARYPEEKAQFEQETQYAPTDEQSSIKPDGLKLADETAGLKPSSSIPPDKLKEWEEWEGPEEWN